MTRITHGIAAALALAAIFPAAPAQAQGTLTRTFVSSTGLNSNPCTITQPCASFQTAFNAVAANGIIAALDPGKYGPLNITYPVTVNGNGWAAITGTSGASGITINAVSGNVILTGLELDGAGAAFDGIVFNTGSSLTVTNCTLQNFTSAGILMQPVSGTLEFTVTNSTVSNNLNDGATGLSYFPQAGNTASANGVIDHVVANNNYIGMAIDTTDNSSGSINVAISNSIASNNNYDGFSIKVYGTASSFSVINSIASNNIDDGINAENLGGGATMSILIDSVNASSNGIGIAASGNSSKILLGHSVVTSNSEYGIFNQVGTAFYTYQNNEINLNAASNQVGGTALSDLTYQ
jgi:hypothetical protein